MQTQPTPANGLACTLMEDELKARRQHARKTLKPYITSVETAALGLTMTFSVDLEVARIEEFVDLERQCCGFLTFNIVQQDDATVVQITGPEGSEPTLSMFAEGARR